MRVEVVMVGMKLKTASYSRVGSTGWHIPNVPPGRTTRDYQGDGQSQMTSASAPRSYIPGASSHDAVGL